MTVEPHPDEWRDAIAAKRGPCRICDLQPSEPKYAASLWIEYHELVTPADGGAVCPDNIVPLCHECHVRVDAGDRGALGDLLAALTFAEHAYYTARARGG
jgi:hypothetical protein